MQLLREVERRSPSHLHRLSREDWPIDPHDGGLALRVVFEVLNNEVMPSRKQNLPHDIGQIGTKDAIDLIRAAMKTLFRPFVNKLKHRDTTKVHPSISAPHEDNLPTLIRWMMFMHKESSSLYDHCGFPRSCTMGPMLVAQSLQTILRLGSEKLCAEIKASPEALELVLASWWWRDDEGRTMHYRFLAEADDRCPAVGAFLSMIGGLGCFERVTNRVHAFTDSEHRKFFGAAVSRLEEWEILKPRSKPIAIIDLLQVTHAFLELPEYAAWYARSQFGPKVLSIARASPDLCTVTQYGLQFVPFPVAISTWLFPMEMMPVVLSYKTLPELLNAGLLEVLADHLLSQSGGTESPWYAFAGSDVKHGVGEPIPILISLCVHRPILHSVLDALSRIPQEKRQRLEADQYYGHWARHLHTLDLYARVWRAEDQKAEEGSQIDLCDNPKVRTSHLPLTPAFSSQLQHHHNNKDPGSPKECSHCQVVVYCSRQCQREDWDSFHKEECPRNRYYRLSKSPFPDITLSTTHITAPSARRIESTWVGHQYRSFLLSLLHHSVLCYEVGVGAEQIEFGTPLESSTLTYHEKTMRPICNFHKARAKATEDAVIYFNTLYCPTKFHLQPLKSLASLSHGGVVTFHEERFKYLLRELRNPTPQRPDSDGSGLQKRLRLGLCTAFCGPHRIWILGLFSVTQDSREGVTTVQKLSSLVKVERRKSQDRRSVFFVPDCVTETDAAPCDDENCLCRRSFCS